MWPRNLPLKIGQRYLLSNLNVSGEDAEYRQLNVNLPYQIMEMPAEEQKFEDQIIAANIFNSNTIILMLLNHDMEDVFLPIDDLLAPHTIENIVGKTAHFTITDKNVSEITFIDDNTNNDN